MYKPGGTNFFTELRKREKQEKCTLCGKMMDKHIVQEGARFHIHRHGSNGIHCTEKDCEINHGYGKCVLEKERSEYD